MAHPPDTPLVRVALRLPAPIRDRVTAEAARAGMPAAVWIRTLVIRELERLAARHEGGVR